MQGFCGRSSAIVYSIALVSLGCMVAHSLFHLQGLKGLPIVAADVVEVAPAYDHAGADLPSRFYQSY